MARNTKNHNAHINIFVSTETKNVKMQFLLKSHIFIKLWKTGFGHFPENTIERPGCDRFFRARTRDKVDPVDLGRHLLSEKDAKRGAHGSPNHGEGGSGERFWSALGHKVRYAPFPRLGNFEGSESRLAQCIWTNKNWWKQHRCSRETRIYWGFSKCTFFDTPEAIFGRLFCGCFPIPQKVSRNRSKKDYAHHWWVYFGAQILTGG